MYKVTFHDGEVVQGGHPVDSGWDKLPEKPIKTVEYWINDKLHHVFNGFEEYCHCVVKIEGANAKLKLLDKVIIMGLYKKRVYQIIFDFRKGKTYQNVCKIGEEFSPVETKNEAGDFTGWEKGKPLTGWRNGFFQSEVIPTLRKVEKNESSS